jgi:hypothetical protein
LGNSISKVSARAGSLEEQFLVEVSGERHSAHVAFAEAWKVALLLRDDPEDSKIKVRDLTDETDRIERQHAA